MKVLGVEIYQSMLSREIVDNTRFPWKTGDGKRRKNKTIT